MAKDTEKEGRENREERKKRLMKKYRSDNGEAKLRMTDLGFDTPEHLLRELTEIPRSRIVAFAMMETLNELLDPDRKERASALYLKNYYSLMRSVNRRHLMELIALAQEEKMSEEEGEFAEGDRWA